MQDFLFTRMWLEWKQRTRPGVFGYFLRQKVTGIKNEEMFDKKGNSKHHEFYLLKIGFIVFCVVPLGLSANFLIMYPGLHPGL
jgi:hypothetical protein